MDRVIGSPAQNRDLIACSRRDGDPFHFTNHHDFCDSILYDPPVQPELIIQTISAWVKTQPAIQAAALVGSHARGAAEFGYRHRLAGQAPETFREGTGWLHEIGWNLIEALPARWADEEYGALWSRRVWLEPTGDEIEFGFAPLAWAAVTPIDRGTRRVITDGCRSLHDPQGLLSRLCDAVRAQGD